MVFSARALVESWVFCRVCMVVGAGPAFFSSTLRFRPWTSLLVPALAPGAAEVEEIICERMAEVMFDGWRPDAAGSPPKSLAVVGTTLVAIFKGLRILLGGGQNWAVAGFSKCGTCGLASLFISCNACR